MAESAFEPEDVPGNGEGVEYFLQGGVRELNIQHQHGWPAVISSLKSLRENGVTVDFGMKGCGTGDKAK
jgi:hypothetical protein